MFGFFIPTFVAAARWRLLLLRVRYSVVASVERLVGFCAPSSIACELRTGDVADFFRRRQGRFDLRSHISRRQLSPRITCGAEPVTQIEELVHVFGIERLL